MVAFSDLKLHHRTFVKKYPFVNFAVEDNPRAKLKKPLKECKFALVTTAGLMLPTDKRFINLIKVGDPSFREIPDDIDVQNLIEDHDSSSFDHQGIRKDKNLALPLERFRELENQGEIGSLK